MNNNGLILFETDAIVCIVTGLTSPSNNDKTDDMLQTWFLHRHIDPVQAAKTGKDSEVCFNCKHRGSPCYVILFQAPLGIWRCYKRGNYAHWDGDTSCFNDRVTRFGSYGEPVLMPIDMMRTIADASLGWTGYTHQWSRYPHRKRWLMASVDSDAEKATAKAKGWRTYHVTRNEPDADEIACPSNVTTCSKCLLCSGTSTKAKSIVNPPHGAGQKYFSN